MLGKNQIQRMEQLSCLEKLDVLDLHSNRIKEIQNISHLKHLRIWSRTALESTSRLETCFRHVSSMFLWSRWW